MKPFERAYIPDNQIQRAVRDLLLLFVDQPEVIAKQLGFMHPPTVDEVAKRGEEIIRKDHAAECEVWRNDTYQVALYRDPNPLLRAEIPGETVPPLIHLSIKRIDREPIHDWRDLQEIKNMLVGEEAEGVELYPAESRRVDTANQYHMYVMPPGVKWPFGFSIRMVADHIEGSIAKQRKLK